MKKNNQTNRYDFNVIESWVHQNSKVLDLGCGDGLLLNHLKDKKNITGFGIEKDKDNWLLSLKNGVDVIQMDLESGLAGFEDNSFDTVILSRTIQSMHNIQSIISEMQRVAKEIIVTFPNFGYWRNRFQIIKGGMPLSKELPYNWYNTPNIHLCTINDFDNFCTTHKISVVEKHIMTDQQAVNFYPNLFGALALYKLVKK
ncbi:MAG: methionine biosynthesis protein MetW [Nitrosomonadales bacterium]|jgi:methionine biosynthesis protein MetW|nr:methionine biosynthesis protein MetW [Nitrosomonadales bacterium]|tara:strand:- start:16167 stop:16766 length:600 start_codon:yes stop_codon:yes gene_type:complete